MPPQAVDRHVLAQVHGDGLGVVTLQRPEALHALSLGMVRELTRVLWQWRHDKRIERVLLQGGPCGPNRPPAFCAGGDIRALHEAALSGDSALDDFFTEEYRLDHLIHNYGKPVIAVMDGVTLGGGMGLAQGASLRVVTERSRLGMPETLIGLFPDVGGGWFLSRCPGRLGEYLGLTGQPLNAGEAIACGLADVHLPSQQLADWIA